MLEQGGIKGEGGGGSEEMKEAPKVEIKDKILLTIEEAAAYSGISATVLEIE